MQYVVPFITLVIGMFLGNWLRLYISRPKLTMTGGGTATGREPPHRMTSIQVAHRPGLFGIRLDESTLFGKQLHGRLERGLTVERNTANDCRAYLLDKDSGDIIAPLYWRIVEDGVETLLNRISIACGESAQLMLFSRLNDEPLQYFPYAPENTTPPTLRVPADNAKLTGTREFTVRVVYDYDRQRLNLDVTMRQRAKGQLEYRTPTTGGSF